MTIRWYLTNLPPLPGWSVINSRDFDSEPWAHRPVGELPTNTTPRVYNGLWTPPPGLRGQHICNLSYFRTGQPWPYTGPPVLYDVNWIPLCCGAITDQVAGGLEIGGECGDEIRYANTPNIGMQLGGAAGDFLFYSDSLAGGMEIGGSAGDVYRAADPLGGGEEIGGAAGDSFAGADSLAGGLEIGGECGDVFTPGSSVPGTTCAGAGFASLGTLYFSTVTGPAFDWWLYAITGAGTHPVAISSMGINDFWSIYFGSSCTSMSLLASGTGNCSFPAFCPGPGTLYVTVTAAGPPYSYSIIVT